MTHLFSNAHVATPARRRAFTLLELVVVISIIFILIALLFPAIGMVRNAVMHSKTASLIDGLSAALEVYNLEDGRHRYPPIEPDQSMRTNSNLGGPARTLDLLRECGSLWRNSDLDSAPGSGAADRLIDAWGRPVRYAVDDLIDQVIDRPAPLKTNWNPKSREPYSYVWSLGKPSASDTADADPAAAGRWIYHGAP